MKNQKQSVTTKIKAIKNTLAWIWKQKDNPPIKAGLWIVGIYIALYGLVSGRYQSKISIVENRINTIITGLSTPGFKQAISRISETQKMQVPTEPDLWKFWQTCYSFFGGKGPYKEGVEILKQQVENWKDSLYQTTLRRVHLEGASLIGARLLNANLDEAHLEGAVLVGANLEFANILRAHLEGAHLEEALLCEAHLEGAHLERAGLLEAHLERAHLEGAHLERARLSGANLDGANFEGAHLTGADLTGADLSKVKSFYMAKLDSEILTEIKIKWPEKLATIQSYNRYTKKSEWSVDSTILDKVKKPDWHGWPEEKEQAK